MDTLYQNGNKEKGFNKILWAAIGIAVLLIAAIIGLLFYLKPATEQVKEQVLEGAYREGSPEFAELTRRIIITNDAANTMESPTGLGTITMFPRAEIQNFSNDKTITGLEIKVDVVDPFDKVIREKTVIIVPKFKDKIAPQEKVPVTVPIEGFAKDDDRARVRWKVTAIKTQ